VALGIFDLLKGLDVEEAIVTWMLAALLVWGRDAFHVRHDGNRLRTALWRIPASLAMAYGVAVVAVVAASEDATPGLTPARALHEAANLLVLTPGPLHFHGAFRWLPIGLGLVGVATVLHAAYLVFRPIAAPRDLPEPRARRLAQQLVRRHGADTLSFFKLRQDKHYLFSPDRRAFVAYRIEGGVLMVSGDPIGPDDALPALVNVLCAHAVDHGLRLGVLGASERLRDIYEQAGLRAFYIGDEAIVETSAFSLEGRPIRKVRQSVTRLRKAGYTTELHPLGALAARELRELEAVSERWRDGACERGFSMTMDSLRGEHQADSLVVVARDETGTARAFLHLVPTYGRAAMSLSLMRRERDTPNGLTEFLVAEAIGLLREHGIEEVSLNFASFARLLHSPSCPRDRVLGRLVALGNPYFQIESLYRFNAKFFPRWEPRYLLYEGALGFPRAALAAMWVEGQLPKPRPPGRAAERKNERDLAHVG